MGVCTALAVGTGAVVAVVAAPLVLGAVGFTSAGITAGSYAATMMSAAAAANGGAVAAGSTVAALQAAGAAGLSGAATAAVAATGAAVLEVVNKELRELCPESKELIKVVIITNDQVNVRQRLIEDHKLFIELRSMEDGESLIDVLKANHADLYLSDKSTEVEEALGGGIAAATMFTPEKMAEVSETQLRVAFDGDAVLFSDESEQVFAREGLDKFNEHEKTHENTPMNQGPFKGFLEALGKLQKKFYDKGQRKKCPIRTYLVTSRGADSSGTRALNTLQSWGLEIDEPHFMAGKPKGPLLKEIGAHIFFDDDDRKVKEAAEMGIVACHVPYDKWVSS